MAGLDDAFNVQRKWLFYYVKLNTLGMFSSIVLARGYSMDPEVYLVPVKAKHSLWNDVQPHKL